MAWIGIIYATGRFVSEWHGWDGTKTGTYYDQLQTDSRVLDGTDLVSWAIKKLNNVELDGHDRIDRIDIAWCQYANERTDSEQVLPAVTNAASELASSTKVRTLLDIAESNRRTPWRYEDRWFRLAGNGKAWFSSTVESRSPIQFWYLGTTGPYRERNGHPLAGSEILEVDDDTGHRGGLPDYITQLGKACYNSQQSHSLMLEAPTIPLDREQPIATSYLAKAAKTAGEQQTALGELTATGHDLNRTRQKLSNQLNRLAGGTLGWAHEQNDSFQQGEALARVQLNTDEATTVYTTAVNVQTHFDAEQSTKATRINSAVTLALASIAAALALAQVTDGNFKPETDSIKIVIWASVFLAIGSFLIEAPYRPRPNRLAWSALILVSTPIATWLLIALIT